MNFTKKVNYVLQVPDNNYCWDGHTPCEHFDNEGGHGRCLLNIDVIDRDKLGRYRKPDKCLALVEVT